MSNKKEREKRREERLQEEAKAQTGDRRTKLLQLGAGAVFLVIVAVVVLIVANSGGSSGGDAQNLKEVSAVDSLVSGVPQDGMILGDSKAPVELIEYGDLQCPVCKAYSEEILPQIIDNKVKSGKAKVTFHNFTIIGEQSLPAGAATIAAGDVGKNGIEHGSRPLVDDNGTFSVNSFGDVNERVRRSNLQLTDRRKRRAWDAVENDHRPAARRVEADLAELLAPAVTVVF